VLSDDADASVVGAGSLKDSKSGADAGTVAGAGEVGAAEASDAAGVWGAIGVGGPVGAWGPAVWGPVAVRGSPTHVDRPLPHDWQLVWPRNISLAAQNGQTGSVDP